jgi:hypothetical protein
MAGIMNEMLICWTYFIEIELVLIQISILAITISCQSNVHVIGTEILPGLGRRLYGWKEEERGAGRVRRRTGAVVAWRRRRRWRREAARVWELRLLRESATNMFIACLNT